MSLVTLPEELYCQVIRRLNHDDNALDGFDKRTARFGRTLQEKYRRYSQEVNAFKFRPFTGYDILEELRRAQNRERAFGGVRINPGPAKRIVKRFADEFCNRWFFMDAFPRVLQDPKFHLEFANRAFTLKVGTTLYTISTPENLTLRVENKEGFCLDVKNSVISVFKADKELALTELQLFLSSKDTTMLNEDGAHRLLTHLMWESSLFSATFDRFYNLSYRLR